MCVFEFNFCTCLWEKRCFEKQCVRFWLVCQHGICIWGKPGVALLLQTRLFLFNVPDITIGSYSVYVILNTYFVVVCLLSVNYGGVLQLEF